MKIRIQLFSMLSIFLLIALSSAMQAQTFKEGKLVYNIEFKNLPTEINDIPGAKDMLPNILNVYVKGMTTRSEISSAMAGTIITIADRKARKSTNLIDIMGSKYAMVEDDNTEDTDSPKIEAVHTKDKKKIKDFECSKTILKVTELGSKETVELVVWHTKDIVSGNAYQKHINGFPLEFEMNESGIIMNFVLASISEEKVSDKLFKVPDGYETLNKEELMKKIQGQ